MVSGGNLPSAPAAHPVEHIVEYRSDDVPRQVPGFQNLGYSKRTSSIWLHPERHSNHDALIAYLMREFRIIERPGYEPILYWNDGPITDQAVPNELTPGADIPDLIRGRFVHFLLTYIPTPQS